MKINKIYSSFTGQVDVGKLALFIELNNEEGLNKDLDYIKSSIEGFDTIVLKGNIAEQISDVSNLINSVKKDDHKKVFILYIEGNNKLSKIKNYDNIILNVEVLLSKTEIEYEDRIKEVDLVWYINMDSNFVFDIIDSDDVDEVNLIVDKFRIKKNRVYLCPINSDDLGKVLELAKFNGYNFGVDFKRFLWEEKKNG